MSISGIDCNIKLWNINNWNCLLNLENIYNREICLDSVCFLNNNNQIYIIISNNFFINCEKIKVLDLNGNQIKEIDNSEEETYFIDSYYDSQLFKNYIITGNKGYVKSYDYDNNRIYHKYYDKYNEGHCSIVINNNKFIQLIESSEDGNIRIWDFHSGILYNKIKISDVELCGICLWNKDYIFIGCRDKTIKLININENKIIKNLIGHEDYVITVKKIIHPKYGECIISQGHKEGQIKLWKIKK